MLTFPREHPEQAVRSPAKPPGRHTFTVRARTSRTANPGRRETSEVDTPLVLEAASGSTTPDTFLRHPATTTEHRLQLVTLRGLRHPAAER